jgi:hypothetical protein
MARVQNIMDKWVVAIKIMIIVKSILILKLMECLALKVTDAIYVQLILKDFGVNMHALPDKLNI